MASIMYEIDPGGDLNLVLKDPNTQRIVPTLCKEAEDDSDDPFNNPPLVGRYEIFNEADEDGYNPEEAGVSGPGSTEVTDITEVRMRVSSRHLILASRTFRKMLEGDWSDSSSKAIESGRRQIYTSGWDAAALAIVMDAIHGRHRDIPKSVNLGLMTRIATIVDYYELHESLQLIRDVWMTALRNACVVTTHYCKSTFLWLYLAWVFSEKDIIPPIIKMLLQQSNGFPEIDSFDLPVGGIMDVIEIKRQQYISKFMRGLEDLRETLIEEDACPHHRDLACSVILLGILIRVQRKLELRDPPLTFPYIDYRTCHLKLLIGRSPVIRPESKTYCSCEGGNCHPCTIESRLEDLFKEIEDDMESFELTGQE